MKVTGVLFIWAMTVASSFRLQVFQTIDRDHRWHAIITNLHDQTITTRVNGQVIIHDGHGKIMETFRVPLGGLHLDRARSCTTSRYLPRGCQGLAYLRCNLHFPDLNHTFTGSIQYHFPYEG